jgi:hypothetical protein
MLCKKKKKAQKIRQARHLDLPETTHNTAWASNDTAWSGVTLKEMAGARTGKTSSFPQPLHLRNGRQRLTVSVDYRRLPSILSLKIALQNLES